MDNRNVILKRCDLIIFYAVCGLAFFIPISIALVEWMFGIALIAWLVKRGVICRNFIDEEAPSSAVDLIKLVAQAFKPCRNVLNGPMLIFLIIVLVSAVFGFHPFKSISAVLTKIVQWLFTTFLVLEAVNSKKRVQWICGVLLASIMLITVNAVVQYGAGSGFIRQRTVVDGRRVMSSFRHPNDFAGWLTIMLPVLFSFSFIQLFHMREGRDAFLAGSDQSGFFQSKLFIGITAVLLALASFALGVTYSRGGWLACGLVLFLMVVRRPRMLVPFLVIGGLFLAVFVSKMVQERTTNITGSYKQVFTNVSDRGKIWGEGLELVRERPVLGIGFNNYLATVKERGNQRQEYAHNCYLQIAAETGLAGLAALLWVFTCLFREGFGTLPKIRDRFPHHFLLGLTGGVGAFLIQSFFDTNFFSTQLSSLLWLTIGLILAIPRTELEGAAEPIA